MIQLYRQSSGSPNRREQDVTVAAWQELLDEAFAGTRCASVVREAVRERPDWATGGEWHVVEGVVMEMFGVAALAAALGRSPKTIRRWESTGVIPACLYGKNVHDPRARRRMYSRRYIEGLVWIADSEGVLGCKVADFEQTRFSRRAYALHRDLRAAKSLHG